MHSILHRKSLQTASSTSIRRWLKQKDQIGSPSPWPWHNSIHVKQQGCCSGHAVLRLGRSFATSKRDDPSSSELRVFNSLTQTLDPLPLYVTENDDSTTIGPTTANTPPRAPGCYTCGPTVYAPAHLGHARTYVWLDIIRRVWEHHRNSISGKSTLSPILFVLNITDVDDKILAAANEMDEAPLDLARRYEAEFWNDWDALGCLRPHVVTRVTEHVDSDIVPYIERLVELGMAYPVPGQGVYFDVRAYEDQVRVFGSRYGKLAPPSQATDLFRNHHHQGGEASGVASALIGSMSDGKRDARDFALWKHRKNGERMYWSSPWGPGRPGWHIECSVMIEAVQQRFGDRVQFVAHAGGVDLKFPHHTNEIAQAEAYHIKTLASGSEWIGHWIHTGHLHIDGMKMSKSLKNFITIQEMLASDGELAAASSSSLSSPADDFRLWCLGLSGSYRGPATYSQERLRQAKGVREKLVRFLLDAESWMRDSSAIATAPKKWTNEDQELFTCVTDETAGGFRALLSDFDGATYVGAVTRIADEGGRYLARTPPGTRPLEVVRSTVDSVRAMLALVGFSDSTCRAGLQVAAAGTNNTDMAWAASPVVGGESALLDELVRFRVAIRELTVQGLRGSALTPRVEQLEAIMEECDRLRDTILPAMGVELLDGKIAKGQDGDSAWRVCVPRSKADDIEPQKSTGSTLTKTDKLESSRISPQVELRTVVSLEEFFRVGQYEGRFSAFDETGFPTLNADGSELSNRLRKKLLKKHEKHADRLQKDAAEKGTHTERQ